MGKMIYVIKPEHHDIENLTKILNEHPEKKFASLMGLYWRNGTTKKYP